MACCSEPKAGKKGGGSCCGGTQPFPWLSVLSDPAIGRMFLNRYWRELLLGLGTGCLTGLAELGFSGPLGALGPLVHGPWLQFHAGVVLPAGILCGLVLALSASEAPRSWIAISGWLFGLAALGGAANGLLELGGDFLKEGGLAYPLICGLLGLSATWVAWGALSLPFRGARRR